MAMELHPWIEQWKNWGSPFGLSQPRGSLSNAILCETCMLCSPRAKPVLSFVLTMWFQCCDLSLAAGVLCKGPPPSLRWAVGHPKDSLKGALFFTNLTLAQHFFMILVDSYICSFPQRHFLSEEARRQWRNGVTHDSWSLPQIPHVFFLCCTVYSHSSFS